MWQMIGYVNNNTVSCVNGVYQNSNSLLGNNGIPARSAEESACILVMPPDTLLTNAISTTASTQTQPTPTVCTAGNIFNIVQASSLTEPLKAIPVLSVPAHITKFNVILVDKVTNTNIPDGNSDETKKYDKYRVIGQCQFDNQPIYVNPKQYHRILKRREARRKLIDGGRIPEKRCEYLHESRHNHALKRSRTFDGKFTANKK